MSQPLPFDALCDLAREAGQATLTWWNKPLEVMAKTDDSPVTAADLAAHRLITEGLNALTPDIPVLSEEDADVPLETRLSWQRFWLVDPLDGTKEFISGTDEFTVNIALIENGQVTLGVVGIPARDEMYWGGRGLGAWQRQGSGEPRSVGVRRAADPLVVVGSRRHSTPDQQALLDRIGARRRVETMSVGSSLKFCQIAAGEADLYPRFGPTSQWDTAAAQAVVEGAGGRVIGLSGERFAYPTRDTWLNPYFIALGELDDATLAVVLDQPAASSGT
ncbi:3'(2'),5'-bisphosphate nucleotidase [Halopseudomonas xinjiangensis]|uniref:3'(2'),5'-bisphosphate nucleotidase CysQ n=1 Tax=Halopseudomonas xinjiangensis TaxID=487184 RepID=A0A1H1LE23_9GAMM|nr:3'(2'),5'-bisphosphate nucleotidase CysQ [Halopseudomonas xinjiangensis]SDR72756.1 3'(2'),5'-bisphosphate nucleotidase [Halopseudomonas xinjiangensis]